MFKPSLPQNARIHIILKMAIIKRQPEAIEPELSKELGIGFSEEVFEQLIKEEIVFLWAKAFAHCSAVLRFMACEPCDEILHAIIWTAG